MTSLAKAGLTMAVTGIAFTAYPVADLPRAIAFYRDTLGLSLGTEIPGYYADFEIGGGYFALATPAASGRPPDPQRSIAFEVDDIQATIAALRAGGVTASDARETPICWMAQTTDPDGNVVVLHQSKSA